MAPEEINRSSTWAEYRRLILQELENLNEKQDRLEAKQHQQDISINTLQVKLSVYAAIGGFLGGLIPTILSFVFSKLL